MRMLAKKLVGALILTAALWTFSAAYSQVHAALILRSTRIEGVAMGDTSEEAIRKLGKPLYASKFELTFNGKTELGVLTVFLDDRAHVCAAQWGSKITIGQSTLRAGDSFSAQRKALENLYLYKVDTTGTYSTYRYYEETISLMVIVDNDRILGFFLGDPTSSLSHYLR